MIYSIRLMIAAALASLAAARVVSREELASYTFEKFVSDFHHPWKTGTEEFNRRKAIFEDELRRVIMHNARKSSYTMSVNKFSAMTLSEKQALNGFSKSVNQAHKPKYEKSLPADFKLHPVSELPPSIDWRERGVVSPVKDQGHCGSCWAFAATAMLESHLAINSGLLYDLSPQQIAMCAPNPNSCGGTGGCHGATAAIGFEYVVGAGIMQEYQIGYTSYYGVESPCAVTESMYPVGTIDGYVKLPSNNYTTLMNALATVGPVGVSVDASTWHSYSSGIYNGCNQQNPDINHAVVLVGYGEENGQKYWIGRNSWSPSWGEKGFIRILRTDEDENNCGLDVTPQHGSACAGETEPVKTCGTCGILYNTLYPTGATH
jgi:cathepsin L